MSPNKRILLVDDELSITSALSLLFERSGYEVMVAGNGRAALDRLDDNPDLVVLDIMMPGMDGFEVCRHIKSMPGKQDIPIIYLTARTEKQDIVEGLHTGAVDYVTKPFNSAELKARVRTHLSLKKAKDRIANQNTRLKKQNDQLDQLNNQLAAALEKIKTLEGIIPMCCVCKNIRNDQGYWETVELYISEHSDAKFSHGICPECMKKEYPDLGSDDNQRA